MYANDAYRARHNKPARARLRGLVRNPAIPGDLLRRLVDDYFGEVEFYLCSRTVWTDEQFDALADHPNRDVRVQLAQALHLRPEQRAKLVEDAEFAVLASLAEGPVVFDLPFVPREPLLPRWAYERLIERDARLRDTIVWSWWAPPDLRDRGAAPVAPTTSKVPTVEELAGSDDEWKRAEAAADPALPADLVARLATDPSPQVRLEVSMRRELTEEQRAAIDYQVGADDRITPARWAIDTLDADEQRRCAYSAHIGLRRSVAFNPALAPDLVSVLATDQDFAVRLLLCENQASVPSETVLATYLEATTITRGRLLDHPALQRVGLARLADSDDVAARCLAVRDPEAPADLVERLSRDPHPAVRKSTASDVRLPAERVRELFADPLTTEYATANPLLPRSVMEEVLADAASLAHETTEGTPTVYLGNWKPDDLPAPDGE